jgi:hypothetical protein
MTTGTERRPETRGRPTLYKGIKMRSRLEADYAGHLDRGGRPWEYEPVCFGGDDGQWLPDFRVGRVGSSQTWLVELKPASLLKSRKGEAGWDVVRRIDEILARASIAWLSEPGAAIDLVFWTYGATTADYTITGRSNTPWYVIHENVSFMSLWPGMGQHAAIQDFRARPGNAS